MALAGVATYLAPASGQTDGEAAPIFGIKIFPGYRDWKLISVAHEAGNLNDIRAILGNDIAIKSYREGKQSFPDGAVIARLSGITYRPKRTTRYLAANNPSLPDPPRNGTCSSWSRTQRNMPQPAAGGTLNLIRTESPLTKRSTELVTPVTCLLKIATMSSPSTHLNSGSHRMLTSESGLALKLPPRLPNNQVA